MDRLLSRYTALCVLSLFLGINYEVGIVLRPFDVLMAFGGLILVGRASVRGYIDTLRKPTVYYLFAAAYSYRCLNGFVLSGMGTAVKETIQVVEFILLVHLVATATRTSENRRRFLRILFIGTGVMAVMTVLWHVGNGHYTGYKELGPPKYLFSFFVILAFGKYLEGRAGRFIRGVIFIALFLAILSGERKGWVAFVGGGGMMYFFYQGGRIYQALSVVLRPRVLVGGGVVFTGLIVTGLQFEYVSHQFETMRDLYVLFSNFDLQMDLAAFETSGSNLARLYILLFTIRTTIAHPVLGIGTGRWSEALARTADAESSPMIGAHSEYQRFAVENGLTGLGFYVFTWAYALKRSVHLFRQNRNSKETGLLIVLGLSFFGVIINLFLGGGALNILFMALVVGLLVGLENDPDVVS